MLLVLGPHVVEQDLEASAVWLCRRKLHIHEKLRLQTSIRETSLFALISRMRLESVGALVRLKIRPLFKWIVFKYLFIVFFFSRVVIGVGKDF